MFVKLSSVVLVAGLSLILAHTALGEQAPSPDLQKKPQIQPSAPGEWMDFPDIFPRGGQMKIMQGDPATGAADFYFRFPAGYAVPMHFHTPIERVYMERGTVRVETFDGDVKNISSGGYAYFPARAPHKVACVSQTECLFYLHSDGPFDIHLVDGQGRVTRSWSAKEMKESPAS